MTGTSLFHFKDLKAFILRFLARISFFCILYLDESWDENIIDFESRKVKERRAHEEVLSGKYRQPNLIASEIILLH